MEENLQRAGGGDEEEVKVLKVNFNQSSPAELLLSTDGCLYKRCMQNLGTEQHYGSDGKIGFGFEKGVNCSPSVVVAGAGAGAGAGEQFVVIHDNCVIGTKSETERKGNRNGIENGERRDSDCMQGEFCGFDPNSIHPGSSHGNTKPGTGIAETVVESGTELVGRTRKKSETNVNRKVRVKEKKHRPKIFDVMKPKKVRKPKPTQKKPNSEQKREKREKRKKKDAKEKKEIMEGKKPAKKRRKVQGKSSDSSIAAPVQLEISGPLTPEPMERNNMLCSNSVENEMDMCNSNNNLALDFYRGGSGDDNVPAAVATAPPYNVNTLPCLTKSLEKPPQVKVYTRRNRRGGRGEEVSDSNNSDLNFNVQELEFCAEQVNIEQVMKCEEEKRSEADGYTAINGNSDKQQTMILPNFKEYSLAIKESRDFKCVLSLKPSWSLKKKRSHKIKLLPIYRELRKSEFMAYLPHGFPRKKRCVTKRRHDSPISTLDFGSHLDETNTIKKILFMDQNDLPETPKDKGEAEIVCVDLTSKDNEQKEEILRVDEDNEEEILSVDGKSSTIISVELPKIETHQLDFPRKARMINTIQYEEGHVHKLTIKAAENYILLKSKIIGLSNICRKLNDFCRGVIGNQIIITQDLRRTRRNKGHVHLHFPVTGRRTRTRRKKGGDKNNWKLSIPTKARRTRTNTKKGSEPPKIHHLALVNYEKDKNNLVLAKPAKQKTKEKDKIRAEVIPDEEAMKVWILMKMDGTENNEEYYWKAQKELFGERVRLFIRVMNEVQGNKRFSRWKGSVVDSVIGVFLTQNVSDNMSSDCFMRFVATFPNHVDTPATTARMSYLKGLTYSDTLKRDVMDEDSPVAIRLEEISHPKTPENRILRHEHLMTPSFEVKTYLDIPKENVMDECETPESPIILSNLESVNQKHEVLNEVFPIPPTEDEATIINFKTEKIESNVQKTKKTKPKLQKKEQEGQQRNWEELRKEYDTVPRCPGNEDIVDWDAVRCASDHEIVQTIGVRGMNNVLLRIIKDFLNRLQEDHGKIDLEWLRYVPTEIVMEYLLSYERIGLKSLDCVRLLTLYHHAFPVDTNVGRIVVRLGWVPLQPLPDEVHMHLLNDYPILASIQEYLWPRLKALDQETLYELHYQMITFGKVFCTKKKPRCDVCPMKGACKHYASAQRSNFGNCLPSPQDKANEESNLHETQSGRIEVVPYQNHALGHESSQQMEPIVEIPKSPQKIFSEIQEIDMEDLCGDSEENSEDELFFDFTQMEKEEEISDALVLLPPDATKSAPRKLKNDCRLHTEHEVYELPDNHVLLEHFSKREPDDPNPYLFAIWMSETDKQLDKQVADKTVLGTILIPCRTANRGRFPLNGTYFQLNEVFVDYETSKNPIRVLRSLVWTLPKRTVYCASNGRSIFKDLSLVEIRRCFSQCFICVREFDRRTRKPMRLSSKFYDDQKEKRKFTQNSGRKKQINPPTKNNDNNNNEKRRGRRLKKNQSN